MVYNGEVDVDIVRGITQFNNFLFIANKFVYSPIQ